MKFTLLIDGKRAELKDLTEEQKIAMADKMLETLGNKDFSFKDSQQRIAFTDCLLTGGNPHAFFSSKKKMLPERINNACYAGEDLTLLKPTT
jgi:hypothetical protein